MENKADEATERIGKDLPENMEARTSKRMESCSSNGMESKSSERRSKEIKRVSLPNSFKRIKFRVTGTDRWLRGRVVTKHKNKSIYQNNVGISLDDRTVKEYDFSRDIDQWEEEIAVADENIEPCCSLFHSKVLTKAQATKRTGFKEAMTREIRKFESFEAFRRV